MEHHPQLCRNCFAGVSFEENGGTCPVCGWNNQKSQIPGGLPYGTVLASRYVIGRVKFLNGEGMTYAALDQTTKRVVDIREFIPLSIASRNEADLTLLPHPGQETVFDRLLDDFVDLSKGISRLREVTVVSSVLDIFEENYTAYTVYEYEPTVSLRRYVEGKGERLSWNAVKQLFFPVLTALGLIHSVGISHLGLSPETLRVTKSGHLLITGFSIKASRKMGTPLAPDLISGCAAIEQYKPKAVCGEITDVYGFTAVLLFALTGLLPKDAQKRLEDPRLLISRDVLKTLPPFVVTAIANALQVEQEMRTGSFERLKTEFTSAPTVTTQFDRPDALRRLPDVEQEVPHSKGLPPLVWLIGSCVVTFIALVIVASMWLGERGMSFTDIPKAFEGSGASQQASEVPSMVNESLEQWEQKLANGEYTFKLKVSTREFSDTVAEGNIISQSPFAGEPLSGTDTVLVTVSKGSAKRALPDIKGISFSELQDLLTKNGFTPVKEEEHSDDVEVGYVIRYKDHQAGDSLDYGATVSVVVSSGAKES